jgi:hypothetical protein
MLLDRERHFIYLKLSSSNFTFSLCIGRKRLILFVPGGVFGRVLLVIALISHE